MILSRIVEELMNRSMPRMVVHVSTLFAILGGCTSDVSFDVANDGESILSDDDVRISNVEVFANPVAIDPVPMSVPEPSEIRFKDHVESNVEVPIGLDGLVFVDTLGTRVALQQYLGERNVILVFTEGFGGMLCPFCKTQTSRLVANYEEFAKLDTEILVVYPGVREHLDEFIAAATKHEKRQVDRVPFPLVLDEQLSAVRFFNIKSNLAHPSTFIIDKRGNVRLAYVGADMSADRPSIKALLDLIEDVNQSEINVSVL